MDMDNEEYKVEYRRYLRQNINILEDLVFCEQPSFPNLSKMLSKGQAKRRLKALLIYFFQYGNTEPLSEGQRDILSMSEDVSTSKEKEDNSISVHCIRGVEIQLSQTTMENALCKDKNWKDSSWKQYVYLFLSLGLLRRHLPGEHTKIPGDNTPLQRFSVEIADERGQRPVTWYHVPNYETPDIVTNEPYFILSRAEKRAKLFIEHRISVSNVHKDNVRDVLGITEANSCFDTLYPEPFKRVRKTRKIIDDVLSQQLSEPGHEYTTRDELLLEVYSRYGLVSTGELFVDDDEIEDDDEGDDEDVKTEIITPFKIRSRFKRYEAKLIREGIRAVPPTKEDRQRWNLPDRRWIIIDVSKWRSPAS